jgi:hypothetical protein
VPGWRLPGRSDEARRVWFLRGIRPMVLRVRWPIPLHPLSRLSFDRLKQVDRRRRVAVQELSNGQPEDRHTCDIRTPRHGDTTSKPIKARRFARPIAENLVATAPSAKYEEVARFSTSGRSAVPSTHARDAIDAGTDARRFRGKRRTRSPLAMRQLLICACGLARAGPFTAFGFGAATCACACLSSDVSAHRGLN